MKHPAFIIAATTIVVLGTGCVAPQSGTSVSHSIQYENPPTDGYFTGIVPSFNNRTPQDPMGRKFRVAYLQVNFNNWNMAIEKGRTSREAMSMAFAKQFLRLREQTERSPNSIRMMKGDIAVASSRDLCNTLFGVSDRLIEKIAAAKTTNETDRRFLNSYWHDMYALNRELETRYPNLFSSSPNAFPLDVIVGYLADTTVGTRRNSLYEVWLLGIPSHADIVDVLPDGSSPNYLLPQEAFLDPLDAIAAALFKLSPEQWEGLEAANPKDHEWRR